LQLRVKVRGDRARAGDAAVPAGGAAAFLWIEMHAQPLREPADRRCAVVCVLRDIARTRKDIDALREERSEAVRTKEDRARLLAEVSHELRAPLGALLGHAELLAGRTMPLSAEQRLEYARAILQSGRHMLEVVDTLIELSAIEAGRVRLAFEPVDPVALARECCAAVTPAADEAGITLRLDFTNNPPFLRADRRSCRQILFDLLSNVIKVTPRGATLSVAVRRRAETVVFTLRVTGIDSGPVDPVRRGTPFDLSAPQGGSIEGSGLGLSVVRGLVSLHKGDFRVESDGGTGTSVEVSLPIGPEVAVSSRAASNVVRHATPGRAQIEIPSRREIPSQREVPCPPMSIAG
jgi:cell cycle sensor histidine kinase DivJ